MVLKWIALPLICASFVAPALAADEDWLTCQNLDATRGVAACTRMIDAAPSSPKNANAYYSRGALLGKNGDSDGAFADYSKAIELAPDHDYALHNRAMIEDARSQYDLALADFTNAILVNPIGGHFYNRGRVFYHVGRFREAADDFTAAILLWSTKKYSAVAFAARCRALTAHGLAMADARADCDNAVTADPTNPLLLTARAMVRFRQGDFAGVIDDTTLALDMPPLDPNEILPLLDIGSADAYFLRGLAELRQGRDDVGRRDIAAAASDPGLAARYSKAGISQ